MVRFKEQRKAAVVGEYAGAGHFGLSEPGRSKTGTNLQPVDDLATLIKRTARPELIYTHNFADKHDTHVSVVFAPSPRCAKSPPRHITPASMYGCEVWRTWTGWPTRTRGVPVSPHENPAALVGVFDSQISGGKRYDLATAGRRLANATYYASHGTDQESALSFAMDLTPLVENPNLPVADYVLGFVDKFRADVEKRLRG